MDEPLYKRSSFVHLLRDKYTCEIKPLPNKDVLLIQHGPAHKYMHMDEFDIIPYEEVYSFYNQLCLESLPVPSDLEIADALEAIQYSIREKKKGKR